MGDPPDISQESADAMDLKHALYAVEDGLATITLNRPEARNALSEEMRDDLDWIIADIKANLGGAVKAVLITGAGHSFCAGGDVKAMNSPSRQDVIAGRARMRRSQQRLFELLHMEAPVIAAVNGHAAGAGFGLALMADFIFAGPSTRFTCSFGRIGLMPDWGLIYTLPRAVGMQKAKDIVFTSRRVGPDESVCRHREPNEHGRRACAFSGRSRRNEETGSILGDAPSPQRPIPQLAARTDCRRHGSGNQAGKVAMAQPHGSLPLSVHCAWPACRTLLTVY